MKHMNTSSPMFSIIICVYNGERYLDACLRSVLAQRFTDYECVIINDGSDDNTEQICQRYVQENPSVHVLTKENGGVLNARIDGVKMSNGKYILFVDVDDQLRGPNALEELAGNLQQDPSIDLIQFGYYHKYNRLGSFRKPMKEKLAIEGREFLQADYPNLLCNNWNSERLFMPVWAKVYKQSILRSLVEVSRQENVFWGDDLIINMTCLRDCRKVLYLPECFYIYNDMTGGTTRFRTRTIQDLNRIKKNQLRYAKLLYDHSDLSEVQYNQIINGLHAETAAFFLLFLKQARTNLSQNELTELIDKALSQEAFAEAREYYRSKKESWDAVDLLRDGSVEGYIRYLEECAGKKEGIAQRLKSAVKTVIKRI